MAIVYEKAPKDVLELVKEALRLWHPALTACEVTVDVLMASKYERGPDGEQGERVHALKHHGYDAAATIKKTTLQQRVLGQADAVLTIDALGWDELGRHLQVRQLVVEQRELLLAAGGASGPASRDRPSAACPAARRRPPGTRRAGRGPS